MQHLLSACGRDPPMDRGTSPFWFFEFLYIAMTHLPIGILTATPLLLDLYIHTP